MNEAVIQVQDFRKTYGETVAVDGISFEVHRGEIFGLLGPCLLYTSPSPRDRTRSRMPSSA